MKQKLRKITSVLLVVIIISVITMSPITASALTQSEFDSKLNSLRSKYPNYSTWYSSFDGGSQCFGFARLMGYEVFGSYPSTWSVSYDFNSVKAGDIVRYGNNGSGGHSIFVTSVSGSTITFVDCNGNGNVTNGVWIPDKCVVKWDNTTTIGSSLFGYSFSYIRKSPGIETGNKPVDLGTDFYAYIINTYAWKHLTNDGPNVSMRSETGEANQVWRFEKQYDGSYKITNCLDGFVLDDQNFGTTDGTNVAVGTNNDTSAQRWYISGESGAYFLRAACGNLVLDIEGGSTIDGANVQMWTRNDSSAQKFQIWKLSKPSQTYVHCAPGSNFRPTIIWWTQTDNTKYYDIKIWKGTVWEGDAYKILWNLTDTTCEVNLPAGYYEAYVDTRNNFSTTMSNNVIKFTVTEDTPLNLGDDFYAELLVNKNWVNVSNINTNVELAKNNYGASEQIWHFIKQNDGSYIIVSCFDGKALDVNHTTNENGTNVQVNNTNYSDSQKWYIYGRWSGEYYFKPKFSNKVLEVNGSKNIVGDNLQIGDLNYTDAQKFAIWEVEPAKKSELSVESGSSIKNTCFNWTKSDNTDEYEVKVWNGIAFDDDPFITFNTTETSWSTALPAGNYMACVLSKNSFSSEQSKIVSFTVEYVNNVGDVNGDGVISIADATTLQKYLANIVDFNDEQLAVADTNGDGSVSIADATQIQKYLAQLIPSLG